MDVGFTERQLAIMNLLWDRGSATVRDFREELEDDLSYTGVLSVFQTLQNNGRVRHEQEGRAYRYHPTIDRKQAGREATRYVLRRYFDDSPEALLEALQALNDTGGTPSSSPAETASRDGLQK